MILPFLTIAPSVNRGRGVFTTQAIASGTTIEIAPVLVFDPTQRLKLEETLLYDYIFEWGEDEKSAIIALGYVSIYNHAIKANCRYDMDYEFETITIITIKDIEAGEELFINYNADGVPDKPVWFEQH
ncbi:MAG: SET domain-containing protein-lysine N-methyltransferase [Bacteroidetes bacterium]|jgi:SET domain-containing protein|nr:SET domain-containing protein-lysine N-methyltransferase [Bacteroidota bacterium]